MEFNLSCYPTLPNFCSGCFLLCVCQNPSKKGKEKGWSSSKWSLEGQSSHSSTAPPSLLHSMGSSGQFGDIIINLARINLFLQMRMKLLRNRDLHIIFKYVILTFHLFILQLPYISCSRNGRSSDFRLTLCWRPSWWCQTRLFMKEIAVSGEITYSSGEIEFIHLLLAQAFS